MQPALADHPLRGLQRPARESFAAARRVPQCDGVRRGVKSDFVRPRIRSRAVRARVDPPRVPRALHLFDQLEQRSRRRIFLRRVMHFPRPGAVFRLIREQARGLGDHAAKNIYANRIVRAIHHAHAALVDKTSHAIQLAVPSRRAHDGRNADGAEPLEIRHRRVRRRKLDGHVHAAKILGRDARLVHVGVDVQLQAHGKSRVGSELLDQPAHFSVSDDGKVLRHGELPPGSIASESSARTYRRRRATRASKFFLPSYAPRECFPARTEMARPTPAPARGYRW